MSRPAIRTVPVGNGSRPAICRSSVVFPDPDGPIRAIISPGAHLQIRPLPHRSVRVLA